MVVMLLMAKQLARRCGNFADGETTGQTMVVLLMTGYNWPVHQTSSSEHVQHPLVTGAQLNAVARPVRCGIAVQVAWLSSVLSVASSAGAAPDRTRPLQLIV